jgi:hypothetical protein
VQTLVLLVAAHKLLINLGYRMARTFPAWLRPQHLVFYKGMRNQKRVWEHKCLMSKHIAAKVTESIPAGQESAHAQGEATLSSVTTLNVSKA